MQVMLHRVKDNKKMRVCPGGNWTYNLWVEEKLPRRQSYYQQGCEANKIKASLLSIKRHHNGITPLNERFWSSSEWSECIPRTGKRRKTPHAKDDRQRPDVQQSTSHDWNDDDLPYLNRLPLQRFEVIAVYNGPVLGRVSEGPIFSR